jgi:hypothetical protein
MKTKLIIIITFILLIISYCIYSVYSFFTYPSTVATYSCNDEKITITRNFKGGLRVIGDKNNYDSIYSFYNNEKLLISIDKMNYKDQNKILIDCLVSQTVVRLSDGGNSIDLYSGTGEICYLSNPYSFTDYPNC